MLSIKKTGLESISLYWHKLQWLPTVQWSSELVIKPRLLRTESLAYGLWKMSSPHSSVVKNLITINSNLIYWIRKYAASNCPMKSLVQVLLLLLVLLSRGRIQTWSETSSYFPTIVLHFREVGRSMRQTIEKSGAWCYIEYKRHSDQSGATIFSIVL